VLSRAQFTVIRLGSSIAFFGFAMLVWWLVHRVAIAGIAGCLLAFVADTLTWPGASGGSYRHYLKEQGVPVPPPSRFWATVGQVIVVVLALLSLGVVTLAAEQAPNGSPWRSAVIAVWIVAPTVALLYLFWARDARRELDATRNAP